MVLMLVLVPVRRLQVAGNSPPSPATDAPPPWGCSWGHTWASTAGIPEPVRSCPELGDRKRARALAGRALCSGRGPLHCPAEPLRGSAGGQLGTCMDSKRSNQYGFMSTVAPCKFDLEC